MAYTPSSPIALRYAAIRRTIAYSETFRALAGAATEAEALERIIFPDMADMLVDEEDLSLGLKYPRTRAIIDLKEDEWGIVSTGVGIADEQYPVVVRFEILVPAAWDGTNILKDATVRNIWCDDVWRTVLQEVIAASRLHHHPTTGEAFIAESATYTVDRQGLVDVTLPERDLIHETFYAVEITISDSCGV